MAPIKNSTTKNSTSTSTFLNPPRSLQPIKETRAKQSALWRDLILAYCKHEKVKQIVLEEGEGE
jgi:hypothetical protein